MTRSRTCFWTFCASAARLLGVIGEFSITERMMSKIAFKKLWRRSGADPAEEMAVFLALSEGISRCGSIEIGGERVSMNSCERLLGDLLTLDQIDYLGLLADPISGRVTPKTLGCSSSLPRGITPKLGDLVFVTRPTRNEPSEVLVALGGDEAIGGEVMTRMRLSALAAEGYRFCYGPATWRVPVRASKPHRTLRAALA